MSSRFKDTKSNQHPHPEDCILIRGASTHNLKNIDVDFPYKGLIFIAGLPGSGKSSLGSGTLLAEGMWRYIESFSTHVRLFLEKVKRPPVESIQGILPSIGLTRKPPSKNPQIRMVTTTDMYGLLKLLYARFGITISPVSGEVVKKETAKDVFAYIAQAKVGSGFRILAPLSFPKSQSWRQTLLAVQKKGFTRILQSEEIVYIADLLQATDFQPQEVLLLIDRLKLGKSPASVKERVIDSAKTAFFEGQGTCRVDVVGVGQRLFSDRFEADGIQFTKPIPQFFDFNNAHGACSKCGGVGKCFDIDPLKVIPDPSQSISEGAILPWQADQFKVWKTNFIAKSEKLDFPIHRPYKDLSPEEKKLIWKGNEHIKGIHHFFNWVLSQEKNTQFRILYASYYGKTTCRACNGGGLRKEVSYVKINQKSIVDLLHMQIDELDNFLATLTFPAHQKKAADILVSAIKNRVYYLKKVGLGYLSLNRFTATLSGGEYQRARLAKILGSPLVDSLYVLEGISVGLHQHNILPIIEVLLELTDLGNTAVVIGQEESIMRAASTIIDVGPEAGEKGGKIVFQGPWEKLLAAKNSYTADYLAGRRVISVPAKRRPWTQKIELHNIQKNNFKDIHVTFPLNVFVIVTGVSGSGKSTLVEEVLYDSLRGYLKHAMIATRPNSLITGDLKSLKNVKYIQQGVPSKSSRSNVATYVKVFDTIRKIFMEQDLSKSRGYTITDFSFNTSGGRCETCAGEGTIKIDMQIMDDVMLTCQDCQGKQFQEEILEVTYKGKNIIQILDMTISQSLVFFEAHPLIMAKLKPLADLGLGELKIGQPSNTLSSGETQKLKLAQAVPDHRNKMEPTLFIFDEPSSDLHFHDIEKCIQLFRKLLDKGHSVVVIDHHMDMIKSADWIIDVGPDAGEKGGEIIFEGTPEAMLNASNSHTAHHLRIKIARDRNLIKTDEA